MRIDAHQHFWNYSDDMVWITPDMSAIRKNFSPADLAPLLRENNIDGCVAVQVDQSPAETSYLLDLAAEYDFIKGVVGWVDLSAADISEQLTAYKQHEKLKGFRHILQGEEPGFMLQPAFLNGIKKLGEMGFTYDILVFPRHLSAVVELLEQFPDQPFVIDHLAKPHIKEGRMDNWATDMQTIARYPNVCCKVSGMVTEADWQTWNTADLVPYLDVVTEAFGTNRLLFGSDWPVCLVAAEYGEVVSIVSNYFSTAEQDAVFGENASRFYHL